MKKLLFLIEDILLFSVALFLKISDISHFFNIRKKFQLSKVSKIIIMGNGPSLKKDIKKIPKTKNSLDIYALNYFALTKSFNKIKPNFYFIVDTVFWRKDINKNFKKDNSKLFKNLIKINWDMTLYCPENGSKFISNKLKKNKNITVQSVKPRSLLFKSEKLNVFSIKNGITKPVFNNVLIFSLWHALTREVDKVELYGADFSSFKDFIVDQKSNKLYSSPKHFYKNTKAQSNSHYKYTNQNLKKIHTRLYNVSISFLQIYLLSKVAKKLGIKLLNFSSKSYLDSIERPKS